MPKSIMLSLILWSILVMLYVIITVLIMARLSLYKISPSELVPSYWINFGAGAISTFAGFELLSQAKIQLISDIRLFF
ncbi:hypothetical protein V6M85_07920 [Sulfolobus tengchongensis]|uniref:Uncharacterized protein n=1 Tax=Sulfolobus tengchongensis TaxID=207809 RepID=A0AAX4KZS6_9CREN